MDPRTLSGYEDTVVWRGSEEGCPLFCLGSQKHEDHFGSREGEGGLNTRVTVSDGPSGNDVQSRTGNRNIHTGHNGVPS